MVLPAARAPRRCGRRDGAAVETVRLSRRCGCRDGAAVETVRLSRRCGRRTALAARPRGARRCAVPDWLECVVNVSEGRDGAVLGALQAAAGRCLLDVHADPHHNRSVLTLAGPDT